MCCPEYLPAFNVRPDHERAVLDGSVSQTFSTEFVTGCRALCCVLEGSFPRVATVRRIHGILAGNPVGLMSEATRVRDKCTN